jgi:hypothetical protein
MFISGSEMQDSNATVQSSITIDGEYILAAITDIVGTRLPIVPGIGK